jgi:hypothetical protein
MRLISSSLRNNLRVAAERPRVAPHVHLETGRRYSHIHGCSHFAGKGQLTMSDHDDDKRGDHGHDHPKKPPEPPHHKPPPGPHEPPVPPGRRQVG